MTLILEERLSWRDVALVAAGETLALSEPAWSRVETASAIVESIVKSGVRAYGVNTGVGALSDTVIDGEAQQRLSTNLIFSHACAVGPLLPNDAVRAIMAAQVANFSHGRSGVRPEIVRNLLELLAHDCIPQVPSRGSAGYLVHNAHIALVLIGHGTANMGRVPLDGVNALKAIGLEPLQLGAKEGLSLVNGTACATGLSSLALARAERLLDWADAIAALTLEAAGAQMPAFYENVLALRPSKGIADVGHSLRTRLAGSALISEAAGRRTQDALSLRSIPHAHGAARDVFDVSAAIVNQELASATDNPVVAGTPERPEVYSEAHAVAPALGQAMDNLAIALAQIGMMSERRLDRLVNPLVSGLPPFLAGDAGSNSGFMIAQYTAATLCSDNRRLAAPAATDGGITSALQEDFLPHATAAANKLLSLLDNLEYILAIELMAAAQAHDFLVSTAARAAGTDQIYRAARSRVAYYRDDRPLSQDMESLRNMIRETDAPALSKDESDPFANHPMPMAFAGA